MAKFRKPVYVTAGYNTIALGPGRKEWRPKDTRPGIEHYVKEAGMGALNQVNDPANIDEGVLGNFMMSRYCRQGNRPGFIPMIHPALEKKPATGTEGACGSGGLALTVAIKSILADVAETVLCVGVEVQNSVKSVYGADILAGAGHYAGQRKTGHAHFFPGKFSDRAGFYFKKYNKPEATREAMALWYANAIENARLNPKAQEYYNDLEDPFAVGMTPPNPKAFCENINYYDCSKVTDAGTALIFASEEGLARLGVDKKDAAEVISYGQAESDITRTPDDLSVLWTTKAAVERALKDANLTINDIGVFEFHDCFSIGGIIALESVGLAEPGRGPDFVKAGRIKRSGDHPINTTGGLIGYGHPVGASGVRQAVDILHQLTGKAGDCQIQIDPNRPYGLSISMGGDDITVICTIYKKTGI
ncbi:3-ketoacyl-CoA thiolase [bacterium]|nr:3-ketoacyl-CoA thiolase [bacterium]